MLNELTLDIPAGSSLGIVGLNGAGKTTLIKLLTRLYAPTDGTILCDGVDIANFQVDVWRERFAVMSQDGLRLPLTASENITAGLDPSVVSPEIMQEAIDAAGAATLIRDLPNGLRTPLGKGVRGAVDLSGGQWQRIAAARALLATRYGATVLVLDEPTSQLDVRAEAEFFKTFTAMNHLTRILISHRLASVRLADHVVLLDAGSIVESGSHDDLVDAGGRYAQMFNLQRGQFIDER
ncbi:hypothetical protein A6V29_18795 [Blastococcus sp. CCUG 61487]|nr:hypothetical protein A6V29_18795 [Blastococcus sp. CCUG 61487]